MRRNHKNSKNCRSAIRGTWEAEKPKLSFSGCFTIHDPFAEIPEIPEAKKGQSEALFDGSEIDEWDSSLIIQLDRCRDAFSAKGFSTKLIGFPGSIETLLGRTDSTDESTPSSDGENFIHRLGGHGLEAWHGFCGFILFLGEMTQSVGRLIKGKAIFQRADLLHLLWDSTGKSIGIVFLISFLTGLILAFVGAIQLSQFGANIFVADLVSIAMFREMGAMMTGIILAGRTGSAFAAQIGSMKANDELNALQTMGISPFDFIVLPRLIALTLTLPVLAFLASLSGILGGLTVSVGFMDITMSQYLDKTSTSIALSSFLSGTMKSFVFGCIIALTGCFRGMGAGSSAESVGRAATSAVVTSIIWIIIADALFAVLFNLYGL